MKKFLLLFALTIALTSSAYAADTSTEVLYRVEPDAEDEDYFSSPKVVNFIENALSDANMPYDEEGNELDPYTNIRIVLTDDVTNDFAIDLSAYENLQSITLDGAGHSITLASDEDTDTDTSTRHFLLNAPNISLTLDNITLDGSGIGGGIDVSAGSLFVSPSTTFRNNLSSSGGALYISDGSVSIMGGTFSANSSSNGGAIYISGGSLSASGSPSFSANSSSSNGGALSISGGTISIAGSPAFSANTSSADGGALSITGGTVSLTGSPSFTGNRSGAYGGAISYSGSGILTLSGVDIDGSDATNSALYGGAIAVLSGTVSLSDTRITSNSADISGGAVYVHSGTFSDIGGNSYTSNRALNGGAIALSDSSSATLSVSTSGMTLGSASQGNQAANFGGGLYLPASATLTFTGTLTLSGNTALYGGGIYAESVSQLNSLNSPLVFSANTADYGGGLYVSSPRSTALVLTGSTPFTFSGNTAHVDGGAISTLASDVDLNAISVTDRNTAEHAGGFLNAGGNVTVRDSVIAHQTAQLGGGLYVEGELSITGGSFDQNTTSSTERLHGGGAVYVSGDAKISGAVFSGNSHTNSGSTPNGGGAIYVNSGSLALTSTVFTSNAAAGGTASRGGAIYAEVSEVSLSDCLFTLNAASGNGGAAVFSGGCSVSAEDCTMSENSSASAGGAIYSQGTLTVSKGYFSLNRASGNGGAIYFNQHNDATAGTISLKSSMFTQNAAGAGASTGYGGAAYMAPDTATVDCCTFNTNQSSASGSDDGKAGAIYLDTSTKSATASASVIKNSIFWSNAVSNGSANYGGAVYTLGDVSMMMNSLVNNSSQAQGGGLYAGNGTLTVTGNIIVGNSASVGRDVYAEGTITSRGYNRIGIYAKGSDTSWRDDVTGAKPYDWDNAQWSAVTFYGGTDGDKDIVLVSSYQSRNAPAIGSTLAGEPVYLLALVLDEIGDLSEQYRATNIIPYAQRFTLGIDQYDIWGTDRYAGGLNITIGPHYTGNRSAEGTTAEKYDIASITMSGIPNTLKYPGQTASLIAMIRYTNGRTSYGVPYDTDTATMSDGQERVIWESSNPSAVTVDKQGNITALRETSATNGVEITVKTVRYMPSGRQASASKRVIVTGNNGYEYMNISPEYLNYFTQNFLPNVFEYDISAAIADANPSTVRSAVFQRNFASIWTGAEATQLTDLTVSTPEFSASGYAPVISGKVTSKAAGVSMNYQGRKAGDMLAMIYTWTYTGAELTGILGYDLSNKSISGALADELFGVLTVYWLGVPGAMPVLGSGGVSGKEAYEAGALELTKSDGGAGVHIALTVYVGNMPVSGNADGAQIVRSSGTSRVLVLPDGADDGAISGAIWMYEPSSEPAPTTPDVTPDTTTDTDTTPKSGSSTSGGGGGGGCNAFGMGLLAIVFLRKRR